MCFNKKYYEDTKMKEKYPDLKLVFDKEDSNKFWLPLMTKDRKTKTIKSNGEVLMQIDVLPIGAAKSNPVGKARDSPNHSPYLPQPEGRIEFSMNPIKMFNQFVGPELRQKIKMAIAGIFCSLICIAILP